MSIGAGPQPSNFPYGFSNGALVRGVPVQPSTPGKVLWVYNGAQLAPQGRAGSDGASGSFDSPKATIAGALLQCAAGRGDVIYVKSGHVETLTTAAAININVAGVSIIGLGAGGSRPTLNFTASTAATLLVSAADCSLVNFNINMIGITAIASPIAVQASTFLFANNYCLISAGTAGPTLGISATAAASGLVVDGNTVEGTGTGTSTAFLQLVGGDNIQVSTNYIVGAFTAGVGAISNITTATTNLRISGNVLINTTAASTKAITAVAGSTGAISDNRVGILSGTAPFTAAGMYWLANYYGATAGSIGLIQ